MTRDKSRLPQDSGGRAERRDATASQEFEGYGASRHRNVFVAALSGWSDACYTTTNLAQHLLERYESSEVMTLPAGEYYDFQQNRPMVTAINGECQVLLPESVIYTVSVSTTLTLTVLMGAEPNLHWKEYAQQCIEVAQRFHCDELISLGGMFADCPHTRVLPLEVKHSLRSADGSLYLAAPDDDDNYFGPIGMTTYLEFAAMDKGIPVASYLVSIPRYMDADDCPQATLDLLRALGRELGATFEEGDLATEAANWRVKGDVMRSLNPVLSRRVSKFEALHDSALRNHMEKKLNEGVCEQLVEETENFLSLHVNGIAVHSKDSLVAKGSVEIVTKPRRGPNAAVPPTRCTSAMKAQRAQPGTTAADGQAAAGASPDATRSPSTDHTTPAAANDTAPGASVPIHSPAENANAVDREDTEFRRTRSTQ